MLFTLVGPCVERLGEKETLRIWQKVFQERADPMLEQILSEDWQPISSEKRIDVSTATDIALADIFPGIFQGWTHNRRNDLLTRCYHFDHP